MKNNISIDRLNEHLFETIELLKNNKDPKADEHEKIDVETAKTIADLGKVVIDGYKVKAQVLSILSKTENPQLMGATVNNFGFADSKKTIELQA